MLLDFFNTGPSLLLKSIDASLSARQKERAERGSGVPSSPPWRGRKDGSPFRIIASIEEEWTVARDLLRGAPHADPRRCGVLAGLRSQRSGVRPADDINFDNTTDFSLAFSRFFFTGAGRRVAQH